MTEREAYVAFNLTERIGSVGVEELSERCGGVVAAWERYPEKVSRAGGEVDWRKEFELAKRFAVTIVTPADPEYPERLRVTRGHPLCLYVKGEVKTLTRPMLAVVGTRRATSYGLSIANRLAYDLAAAGWGIVSGLALGIDAEAHRGALAAEGVTVGVLGSGLDRFYPEENRPLAREMCVKRGAVISEFAFGRGADQTTFPIRNHVVAALASGVIAVECPAKSGTLITTSIAADLGRTVMAVPSRIDSRMSAGCLQLIRDGAVLVRNADDVLEAVREFLPQPATAKASAAERDPEDAGYSAEEALVRLHLEEAPVSVDELSSLTGIGIGRLNSVLMGMRIRGLLKFLPGDRVSLLTQPR